MAQAAPVTDRIAAVPVASSTPRFSPVAEGALFVLLATFAFSFTLPMTRLASPQFGGWAVGFGRVVIAGVIGAALLFIHRERFPARQYWGSLALVILGVILGFPLLASLALQTVPANHGAVTTGILPIATAIWGAIRARERPPLLFWVSCAVALGAVLLFALSEGAGTLLPEDLLLFGAVLLGAFGYVEGGRLARALGGWRVITWAVVIAAPILFPIFLFALRGHDLSHITLQGWVGFLYLSVVSQFLGFFAMYHGLAIGGIARVSLIQLVQPFLSLIWSALLVGETVRPMTIAVAVLVVANIGFSQWVWARERRREAARPAVAP